MLITSKHAGREQGLGRRWRTLQTIALAFALVLWLPLAIPVASSPTEPPETETDDYSLDLIEILAASWSGDLSGMAERTVIRIATTFSRTHFFLDEGRPRGAVQELTTAFEAFLRQKGGALSTIRIVLLPMQRDQLLEALVEGRADIAAANLTITSRREEQIAFSEPWTRQIREVLVSGPNSIVLETIDDLSGQPVHVQVSSSYYESLQALAASFQSRGLKPPEIIEVDDLLETEDILELVAAGVFPLTVTDNSLAEVWADILPALQIHNDLAINEGREIAWAFRKDSPQLATAVNEFVVANRQGTLLGNILIKRYFSDNRWIRNPIDQDGIKKLDALRTLFQTYAKEYDFDWLLSAAQAYQESALDQTVVSSAGAIGVMQLLPSTAADPNVDIADISSLENNINAGIKYKRFVLDRYFDDTDIAPLDRFLFTLAAYNAGPARINQYRAKAAERGLNANRWFRHVEQVSNRETKTYVSNIFKYYMSYREYQRRLEAVELQKSKALREVR